MVTQPKVKSLEERIAEKVLAGLPLSELVEQMTRTNELVAQLIALNEQFRQDTISFRRETLAWRKESQEHRLAIVNSIDIITNRLVTGLSNLGLPIENPESIAIQQKLVTTAGIAVQLPPVKIPYDCEVVILALTTNTGTIYVGNSKLNAEDHTISFPLLAGESIEYKIRNLSLLWVDASVSGEGIIWTVEHNG